MTLAACFSESMPTRSRSFGQGGASKPLSTLRSSAPPRGGTGGARLGRSEVDLDSTATEDFESRFRRYVVRVWLAAASLYVSSQPPGSFAA